MFGTILSDQPFLHKALTHSSCDVFGGQGKEGSFDLLKILKSSIISET